METTTLPRASSERAEVLGVPLPAYTEVRIASANLTETQPAEYRADAIEASPRALEVLMKGYEYQSDFAKKYRAPRQTRS